MKHIIQCLIVVGCGFVLSFPVLAKDKIDFWLKTEFTQSTLSYEDQYSEMEWFAKKSEPYQGLTIRVTSEIINTHLYEANVLAKAFHDITGIRVIHEVSSEDDIVKKFSYQLTSDDSIYDAHIVDTDLIGLLARSGKVIPIKEIMSYDDGDLTLPTLGIDDFFSSIISFSIIANSFSISVLSFSFLLSISLSSFLLVSSIIFFASFLQSSIIFLYS